LGPYLAGLIEGDGSIYTPLITDDVKINKNIPHIEIAFDIRDIELFKKIQEVLKGGYIFIRANGMSGRLTVKKQDTLINLVNLINGLALPYRGSNKLYSSNISTPQYARRALLRARASATTIPSGCVARASNIKFIFPNLANISRRYTTITNEENNLSPYFITGFCDGESYFNIAISKSPKSIIG
jgi:hypothetical protein